MTTPTLSLVTICWNAAKTLQQTLDAVLAQTVLPNGYLFVDGGSTDGTLELLEKYRPRFEGQGCVFGVIPQTRHPDEAGIPSAWNQAIPLVNGEIVALLNADDWYEPETLETILRAFTPEVDAVSCPVAMHAALPEDDWLFVPQSLAKLPWKMAVPHPGTFFRKRVYDRIGLYDTRYRISADYDFVWRCHKADIHWRYLQNRPLVHMRLGGLANSSRALARRETYRIARNHCAWYDPRPLMAFLGRAITGR
ncbi:MAG: glycosyltransferase [Victivallales bacterium]|nr:glycosyltransferase [Victivallales bacterium]